MIKITTFFKRRVSMKNDSMIEKRRLKNVILSKQFYGLCCQEKLVNIFRYDFLMTGLLPLKF